MNSAWDRELLMEALRSALPYIRLFKHRVFVIKAGGAICGDPAALRELAEQVSVLCELGVRVVLVHGGGPQTTALSDKLGLSTTFVEGRRVTCEKTLEVSVMTVNGSVNTAFLSACRAVGLPAVGVSGLDAGLIRARRRPVQVKEIDGKPTEVDYGLVGDVVSADVTVLRTLLDSGVVPLVSPLSADDSGQVLNVNADTVASTLAQALGAEKLIFITDTAGLLEDRKNPGSLISYIDLRGIARLRESGTIDSGMLPKAEAAVEALQGGVRRVHMVGYRNRGSLLVEVFTNEGCGTLIVHDISELASAEQAKAAEAAAS